MKNTLRILSAIGLIVTCLLGMAQMLAVLPPETIPQKYIIIGMLGSAGLSGLKDLIVGIGDILDDGIRNGSYKLPVAIIAFILGMACMGLTSCGTNAAGEKTFAGVTGSGWLKAGETTAVVILNERAKTAAKQPVNVQPTVEVGQPQEQSGGWLGSLSTLLNFIK